MKKNYHFSIPCVFTTGLKPPSGMRTLMLACLVCAVLCPVLLTAAPAEASERDTVIVYYSRTGNCRLVSDLLSQQVDADILEIKDTRDRSGTWGYYTAAFDSVLNRYTVIQPEHPDLSPYTTIIFVSPIWNWKLSAAIRTVIHENRFDGKELIFFTTGNNEVTKYESYGDDAPFLKRYLRDFLRGKCQDMKTFVQSSGGTIAGYFHVATKERTAEAIRQDILKHASEIKKSIEGAHDAQQLAVR